MLLKSLIALCILLTLALLIPRGRSLPPRVSSFTPTLAKSLVAYRYPAEYYPLGSVDEDYDGPVDSVKLSSPEVASILEVMLNGINYESTAYTYYKRGTRPEYYDMAGCHYPRFILNFKDKSGTLSNTYSICFECGNSYFSNGLRFPRSGSYSLSEEGEKAFRKLQDDLFSE